MRTIFMFGSLTWRQQDAGRPRGCQGGRAPGAPPAPRARHASPTAGRLALARPHAARASAAAPGEQEVPMASEERGRLFFMDAPQHAELLEFPVPRPGPGAIVARVIRANVCGSELHLWRGLHPTIKRGVLGHEMVGRVYALGEGVETD